MTIKAIAPHISCVCDADEIEQAKNDGYREIYTITTKGIFKTHILRGENRWICAKVTEIKGYVEPLFKEDHSTFLPAGKIPFVLFQQVEAFFRAVIATKGAALEAMIFIMWNKDRGYYLHVPKQTVSGASVTYDYENFPSQDTTVVNIHSHGHMNAFFSGVDDNNDSTKVQYSGVFGKFQDPQCVTVWRFNYYTTKYAATAMDIFEAPTSAEIPNEWVDMVEERQTVIPKVYSYQGNNSKAKDNGKNDKGGKRRQQHLTFQGEEDGEFENFNEFMDRYNGYEGASVSSPAITPSQSKALITINGEPNASKKALSPSEKFVYVDGRYQLREGIEEVNASDVASLSKPRVEDEVDTDSQDFWANQRKGFAFLGEDIPGLDDGIESDGLYEALAINHGRDVADAWFAINEDMVVLNGKDDIVENLALDLVQMASEEGQARIFKQMFDNLSPREKEKIQTLGL